MKLAYLPDKLKSVKPFLLTQINVCMVVTLAGSQEWFNGIYLSSKFSDYNKCSLIGAPLASPLLIWLSV